MLRTTDWEKVKVGRGGGEGGRAPQTRPGPPAGEAGASWPASGSLGSLRRWLLGAPSLAGALFLCRETRKLPFDCGSPRPGLGARQRGSEWQRGKGGALQAPAASPVRSRPGAAATSAAAAAAPARRQPGGQRSAPAGRAERAQQVVPAPQADGAAPRPSPAVESGGTAERHAEPWSRAGPVDRAEPAAGEGPENRSPRAEFLPLPGEE